MNNLELIGHVEAQIAATSNPKIQKLLRGVWINTGKRPEAFQAVVASMERFMAATAALIEDMQRDDVCN